MADENKNDNQGNANQSNENSGKGGGKKSSRRRYYRRRGKGKKKNKSGQAKPEGTSSGESKTDGAQSAGGKSDSGQSGGSGQGKQGGGNSDKQGSGKSGSSGSKSSRSSRRRRRSRSKNKQSSQAQSGKGRSRRGRRRADIEPMVEVGVEIVEPKNYVEPDDVYVYEFLIRPAYRDASDYRPDSFTHSFDEANQHADVDYTSSLGTHYAAQYQSQYPTEIHPEDAGFVDEDTELPSRPGQVIREFFANLPPDEESDPEGVTDGVTEGVTEDGPGSDTEDPETDQ